MLIRCGQHVIICLTLMMGLCACGIQPTTQQLSDNGASLPTAGIVTPQSGLSTDSPAMPPDLPTAHVIKVIDGDTVEVQSAGETMRLRLIGVDTPESVHPSRPVECFGREASAKAKALLDGQTVFLEADATQSDQDRYGRYLRYVWLPDGQLFNYEMVAQGYAFEYTFRVPYVYQEALQQAEQAARAEQRGLWASDTCAGQQIPADQVPQASPHPVIPTEPASGNESCDPAYPDVCIPPPPPDLDCGDIPHRRFTVLSPDPHNFDGNGDGIGCEG